MSNHSTKLEAGMMVNVYQDPVSCLDLEGRAKLVRPHEEISVTYAPRWWVQFPGEDEQLVERAINPATALAVLG